MEEIKDQFYFKEDIDSILNDICFSGKYQWGEREVATRVANMLRDARLYTISIQRESK